MSYDPVEIVTYALWKRGAVGAGTRRINTPYWERHCRRGGTGCPAPEHGCPWASCPGLVASWPPFPPHLGCGGCLDQLPPPPLYSPTTQTSHRCSRSTSPVPTDSPPLLSRCVPSPRSLGSGTTCDVLLFLQWTWQIGSSKSIPSCRSSFPPTGLARLKQFRILSLFAENTKSYRYHEFLWSFVVLKSNLEFHCRRIGHLSVMDRKS